MNFSVFVHHVMLFLTFKCDCISNAIAMTNLKKSNEQVEGADLRKSLPVFSGKSSNFVDAQ